MVVHRAALDRQCGCSCSTMGKHLVLKGNFCPRLLRKCKKYNGPDELISLSLVLVQYFLVTGDKPVERDRAVWRQVWFFGMNHHGQAVS